MASVSVKKAEEYDALKLAEILKQSLIELDLTLPTKAHVLLKPNIVSQNYPYQCTTTHPAIVEALCMMLSDNDCNITIGESSAYYEGGYTQKGFGTSGIKDVAKRYSAPLIAFEEEGAILLKTPMGKVLKEIILTRMVKEADYIISAGKLKTHAFAGMTATVKNLFGLVPGGAKYEYHFLHGFTREAFAEKIADLYTLVQPDLFVLDAIYGLEGFGPASTGKPKETGIAMVSANGYALDYLAARIIGVDPDSSELLKAGIRRGIIQSPADIVLRGDFIELPSVPYKLPKKSDAEPKNKDFLYKLVAVYPVVTQKQCTGCGICASACPINAVNLSGTAKLDLEKCMRCFSCYYKCAEKAIRLKGISKLNMAGRAIRKLFRI